MGEAKRRKLLGTYPDTSKPKTSADPKQRTHQLTAQTLACRNCGAGGGTLVKAMADNQSVYVHAPSCAHAKAVQMRATDRRKAWEARQKLRGATPVVDEEKAS